MELLKEATMSMQKKVWVGAAVVLGVALLAPTVTAYANRQREASKAAALTEAQRQMQRDAEAAYWEGLAAHARAEYGAAPDESAAIVPVYDSTGAMQDALSVAPPAE